MYESGELISETAGRAIRSTKKAQIPLIWPEAKTVVTIAIPFASKKWPPISGDTAIQLELLDSYGRRVEAASLELLKGCETLQLDELFPEMEDSFTGTLQLTSENPFAAAAAVVQTTERSDPIITRLPVADAEHATIVSTLIIPHLLIGSVDAGEFSADLVPMNQDSEKAAVGTLDFYQPDGSRWNFPTRRNLTAGYDYRMAPLGTQRFQAQTCVAPAIVAVQPSQVSMRGGEKVIVKGRNFTSESKLLVGRQEISSRKVMNSETIEFTCPAMDVGRANLSVLTRDGIAQAPFLVNAVAVEDLEPGQITTLVGGSNYVGDGGPATSARVGLASGLTMGMDRNLYIVGEHRVRKVDTHTGIITTVAGIGTWGFTNPGKLALSSPLDWLPGRVAVDATGSLYVSSGNRVLRVDFETNLVEAFAGNGEEDFSGDGGPAIEASLTPGELILDPQGNLFIADDGRVRKVDAVTSLITTVAGNGEYCRYCDPDRPATCEPCDRGDGGIATEALLGRIADIAVDPAGNIYVLADGRVRRVDSATGIITTVVGGGEPADGLGDDGPALDASIEQARGLALDSEGNLLIEQEDRIRKVDLTSGIIATVTARVGRAYGISTDFTGRFYFTDRDAQQVYAFDPVRALDPAVGPIESLIAGVGKEDIGDGGPAVAAKTSFPVAVDVTSDGGLWLGEDISGRVRKIDPQDHSIRTVYRTACNVADLVADEDGSLFTSENCYGESGGSMIRITDVATGLVRNLIEGGPGSPYIAFSPDGELYFSTGGRIQRLNSETGQIEVIAGNGEYGFSGEGGPAIDAELGDPRSLAFDEQGNLFVAEWLDKKVRMIDATTGIIRTVAGNGTFGFSGDGGPATEAAFAQIEGIVVDDSGNLYISDMGNHRVRRVDLESGVITTAVGTGSCHIRGDGGLATAADVCAPHGLAIDGGGNLYIADRSNQLVRAVRRPVN
jgi:DNA-binding beta-propeller fold protein YncE